MAAVTKWSCKGRSPRTPFFESGTRSARHPRRHLEFCAEQICPWIGLAANADAAQSSHLWIAVPGLRALTSRFAASAARMRDSHPSPRPAKESYVAFSANHASEADAGPPASSTFLPAGHACPRTRSAALGWVLASRSSRAGTPAQSGAAARIASAASSLGTTAASLPAVKSASIPSSVSIRPTSAARIIAAGPFSVAMAARIPSRVREHRSVREGGGVAVMAVIIVSQ
jgi:hypothetical protein